MKRPPSPGLDKKKRGKKKNRQTPRRPAELPAPPRSILGRVLKYGDKVFGLCAGLRKVVDGRVKPRVPAGRAALAYLLLMLSRLGSLNALEQRKAPLLYEKWLGGPLPSADVMGSVAATMNLEQLRGILYRQHRQLKRNKGFLRGEEGFRFLILDGHEGVSSYKRSWKDCLERTVHCAKENKTQHYFRYVAAYLSNGRCRLMLDAEPQLPGEGEIACAVRLLVRVLKRYPRAFDVVCGDNLYMNPGLWKLVRRHGKHIIAVLKNEDRDLLEDARSLFVSSAATGFAHKGVQYRRWDLEGFTTWPQCGESVRVVRTIEASAVKRQIDGEEEGCVSEWFWVTSLPKQLADTQAVIRAGHGRWAIENQGFNELCNQWHGDHAYKYETHALIACTLLLFIAYNLFHAFIERNIKPQARAGRSQKYWADLIAAEFATAFHPYAAPT